MDFTRKTKTFRIFWMVVAAFVIFSMVGFMILPYMF